MNHLINFNTRYRFDDNYAPEAVPVIDWLKLMMQLEMNTRQSTEPEEVVHEICHIWDISGPQAFIRVGNQTEVGVHIRKKYETVRRSDLAEIRVSALTMLVIEPFGYGNFNSIFKDMLNNLARMNEDEEDVRRRFFSGLLSEKNRAHAKHIQSFIMKFEKKP